MKIILTNLPWKIKGRFGVRAGSRWPFTSFPDKEGHIRYVPFPFFLAYAAALLKRENKNVKLIDAIAEEIDEKELFARIESYKPGLIVVETSTPSFENDIKHIKNIRDKSTDCRIALCGPHAGIFSEEILAGNAFIDYILIGEYEYTLLELARSLRNGLSLESIKGLAYREDNKIKINERRSTIGNLDALPWPEREDVPICRYNDGFAGMPTPNVQMWTSRGCPFQCTYCLWPQTIYKERKHRVRNPVDVVNEMAYLVEKFGFKAVFFDDDVFNMDRAHVFGICEEIKKKGLKIPWAAMARIDLMDEELLNIMSNAGLYAIKYGIESADNGILKLCKKSMRLDNAARMIDLTKKSGIKVHLTFCLGLPGETRNTIEKTIEFINKAAPDSLQFSFATPFPGTEYYEYAKSKGWLVSDNFSEYDGNYNCAARTRDLTAGELEEIRNALSNNFNF